MVKLLLDQGADISVADADGWTPLNAAASSGHLEVVKLLLDQGADISVATSAGSTPLDSAAYSGHLEVGEAVAGQRGRHLRGDFCRIDAVIFGKSEGSR